MKAQFARTGLPDEAGRARAAAARVRRSGDFLRGVRADARHGRPADALHRVPRGRRGGAACSASWTPGAARRARLPSGDRPAGAFAGLDAATLGFLTEPLPRTTGTHDDLEIRLKALRKVDRANFDRIVAFDHNIVSRGGGVLPVWRSLPLPVDDRFFADVDADPRAAQRDVRRPLDRPPRAAAGRPPSTAFDVLHLAFGVDAARLDAR